VSFALLLGDATPFDGFDYRDLLHAGRVGYLCCYAAVNLGLQAVRDGKSGSHDGTIA
jgi:hypothetical protein